MSCFPLAHRWLASLGSGVLASIMSACRLGAERPIRMRSDEEEFVYVLEGYPEAWINGYLWKLSRATAWVFLPEPASAIPLSTTRTMRFLVVGEANKKHNRIYYPLNPVYAATREDRWVDHPPQFFGPHDGKPGKIISSSINIEGRHKI
jgi:uncharacterized cupin superfamily protein